MRILVACEFSGVVRDAFRAKGHDAVSCDFRETTAPGPHIVGNVLDLLSLGRWDMMIAHPPCTYLCSSGLHWNARRPERAAQTEDALDFVRALLAAPIAKICLENPIGCISSRIAKPSQIIQPHHFGDDASKSTCLWLVNLPPLLSTSIPTGGGARDSRARTMGKSDRLRTEQVGAVRRSMGTALHHLPGHCTSHGRSVGLGCMPLCIQCVSR